MDESSSFVEQKRSQMQARQIQEEQEHSTSTRSEQHLKHAQRAAGEGMMSGLCESLVA